MLIPPQFYFSLSVLTLLRVARSQTWLTFGISALLSLAAFSLSRLSHGQPQFFVWLGAAGWVCTLRGSKEPVWMVFLLPMLMTPSGWLGLFTGIALNLPLPRNITPHPSETYGITRVRSR